MAKKRKKRLKMKKMTRLTTLLQPKKTNRLFNYSNRFHMVRPRR